MLNGCLVFVLFLLSISCVSSELVFDITMEANPKFYSNFTINVHDGVLDMSAILIKDLSGKFMWKSSFFRVLTDKNRIKYIDIPKLNYCTLRRNLDMVPVLTGVMKHVGKYGNFTPYCPWKRGVYLQRNLPLDENFVPMGNMIPKGRYLLVHHFADENRKPEMVMKFFIGFTVL